MIIFGFDLSSVVEYWLLTCVCSSFAEGFVKGFWRAYQEYKKGVEHDA